MDLMQLGLQLFSQPFAGARDGAAAAAAGGASSSDASGSSLAPAVAQAMDCVVCCLAGKGTQPVHAGGAKAAATEAEAAGAQH